jgi:tRNA-specific 2-thiouridylase
MYGIEKGYGREIVVGMSGGVDSSVALILLKKAGWKPIGLSLKLPVWKSKDNLLCENMCCTEESLRIANSICKKLKVPYHVSRVEKDFRKKVIDYFTSELSKGRTPNPCVICNRYHKFEKLIEWAKKNKIDYVASGHYAKKSFNKKTNEFELLKARDKTKDQTYGLSFLIQKQLKKIIFPLGKLKKEKVFKIAEKEGFEFFLKKKQSQDFCFISNKSFPKFIEKNIGVKKGDIVDEEGNILGKHKGIHFYTIGQKKGLKLMEKYYVKDKNKKKNQIVVTKNKNSITKREINMKKVNFIVNLSKPIKVMAKTRYRQDLASAKIYPLEKKIIFKKPQHAVTPGQFCVFYKGKVCLGGGIIK